VDRDQQYDIILHTYRCNRQRAYAYTHAHTHHRHGVADCCALTRPSSPPLGAHRGSNNNARTRPHLQGLRRKLRLPHRQLALAGTHTPSDTNTRRDPPPSINTPTLQRNRACVLANLHKQHNNHNDPLLHLHPIDLTHLPQHHHNINNLPVALHTQRLAITQLLQDHHHRDDPLARHRHRISPQRYGLRRQRRRTQRHSHILPAHAGRESAVGPNTHATRAARELDVGLCAAGAVLRGSAVEQPCRVRWGHAHARTRAAAGAEWERAACAPSECDGAWRASVYGRSGEVRQWCESCGGCGCVGGVLVERRGESGFLLLPLHWRRLAYTLLVSIDCAPWVGPGAVVSRFSASMSVQGQDLFFGGYQIVTRTRAKTQFFYSVQPGRAYLQGAEPSQQGNGETSGVHCLWTQGNGHCVQMV
jgi:hypothetical protein